LLGTYTAIFSFQEKFSLGTGETGNEYNADGSNSAATVTAEGGFSVTITAVPEPASISLLGLGAMSLLARRRRTAR
jgi:hypothetical protein